MPEALFALPALLAGTAPLDLATGTGILAGTTYVSGVAIGSTALVSTVASVGLTVGLSYAANLLAPRPSSTTSSSQNTVNEPTAARTRAYGRCKLGGARVLWENSAGSRITAIAHCQGPVAAVEEYWFGDKLADFIDGYGPGHWGVVSQVTNLMLGYCHIQSFAGTGAQASSTWIPTLYGAWRASDRLAGLCYTFASYQSIPLDNFPNAYEMGEPAQRHVIQCTLVWDPRDQSQNPDDSWTDPTTWAWSDNPALAILDYLRHPMGRELALDEIDVASFAAFADLCDQSVSLKHGGTEKRYRLWGSYSLMDEPASVQKRMLATCDGELWLTPAGKIAIRGGAYVAPTVEFSGDAVLDFQLTQGAGRLVAFNETTITYISPDHDYQSTECDPWIDTASQAQVGVLSTALDLDMVPSHSQARRIAKIEAAKGNPAWKGKITLDCTGLQAIGERVVRITLSDLGVAEEFLITRAGISGALDRVTLDVVSYSAAAYDWDPATEEGEPTPVSLSVDITGAVEAVSGVTVVAGGGEISVLAAPPADTRMRFMARFAPHGSTDWLYVLARPGVWSLSSAALVAGVAYDVQAILYRSPALHNDWSAVLTVAV